MRVSRKKVEKEVGGQEQTRAEWVQCSAMQ
jgi:hypothetical protein